MDTEHPSDGVVRAITHDGAFRVITASLAATARDAVAAQRAHGATARRFAELMTGTVLVRETMAPNLRVQGIAKGAGGPGRLVADSHPGGGTRGLVQLPSPESEFALGKGSLLQVMRSLPRGGIQQGVVDVSASGGLSEAFMAYMQESEQVVSVIAMGTRQRAGEVERAGGYVVQLLPEVERGPHMIMTQRLADFPPIEELLDEGFTPRRLMGELLFGMEHSVVDESPLRFECRCSLEAVIAALATLGKADIAELVGAGRVHEIECDYCRREYEVAPEQLRALMEQS